MEGLSSDWLLIRRFVVKQVNSDVLITRSGIIVKDILKPILFVQYGNSCIDLHLCGLNIKHMCAEKDV